LVDYRVRAASIMATCRTERIDSFDYRLSTYLRHLPPELRAEVVLRYLRMARVFSEPGDRRPARWARDVLRAAPAEILFNASARRLALILAFGWSRYVLAGRLRGRVADSRRRLRSRPEP
jgi:hypothetical protein